MSTLIPTEPRNNGNNIVFTKGDIARTALCFLSLFLWNKPAKYAPVIPASPPINSAKKKLGLN